MEQRSRTADAAHMRLRVGQYTIQIGYEVPETGERNVDETVLSLIDDINDAVEEVVESLGSALAELHPQLRVEYRQ